MSHFKGEETEAPREQNSYMAHYSVIFHKLALGIFTLTLKSRSFLILYSRGDGLQQVK